MQHLELPIAEIDAVAFIQNAGQRGRLDAVVGGLPAGSRQLRYRTVKGSKFVGIGRRIAHPAEFFSTLERAGPQRKLVQRADVIEMDVRRDDQQRLACGRVDLRCQRADAHAGIDQQIDIAATHMPDVGANISMHERLGQHRRFGIDNLLAEPAVHGRVPPYTNGLPTLYFSGTSRFR
jgi:hypothetical protein